MILSVELSSTLWDSFSRELYVFEVLFMNSTHASKDMLTMSKVLLLNFCPRTCVQCLVAIELMMSVFSWFGQYCGVYSWLQGWIITKYKTVALPTGVCSFLTFTIQDLHVLAIRVLSVWVERNAFLLFLMKYFVCVMDLLATYIWGPPFLWPSTAITRQVMLRHMLSLITQVTRCLFYFSV